MYLRPIFLVFFVIFVTDHAFASDPSGCIRLRSSYTDTDEADGKWTVEGMGCYIAPDCFGLRNQASFILTAGHVSRGDLGLEGGVEPIGRRADARCDIEWIEIAPDKAPQKPIACWDESSGKVRAIPEALAPWVGGNLDRGIRGVGKYHLALESSVLSAFALKPGQTSSSPQAQRIVLEDVTYPSGTSPKNRSGAERFMEYLPITGEYWAPANIVPGMSGGLAFAADSGGWTVRGVTTRYVEDMKGSFFCGDETIARVKREYDLHRGMSTYSNEARFALRKRLTFRDYGNGTLEINPASPESKTERQAGNGVTRDGGNGVTRDGSVSAMDAEFHSKYGIGPGILYRGRPTLAFDGKALELGTIYADANAIEYREKLAGAADMVPAVSGVPSFSRLLLEKKPRVKRFEEDPADQMFYSESENESLGMRVGSRSATSSPQQIRATPEGMLFRLTAPAGEVLEFELDDRGVLRGGGSDQFYPRIYVKGSRGNEYAVDLRKLFFTDLSEVRGPIETKELISRRIREMAKAPATLSFYDVKSGRGFVLPFNRTGDPKNFAGSAEQRRRVSDPCASRAEVSLYRTQTPIRELIGGTDEVLRRILE